MMSQARADPLAQTRPRPTAGAGWLAAGGRLVLPVLLALVGIVWLVPVVWVIVTSLKPTSSILTLPPSWLPVPATLDHYASVFAGQRTVSMGRAFLNSANVSVANIALVIVISSLAAYPLARMRFPGRNLIFAFLVGSLMVPTVVSVVPLYILMQQLGWLSSYRALVLPEAASNIVFGVFLLRQFFYSLPTELEDAARIDGAGPLQIFTRVLLPLSRPALAALAVFSFRSSWNDFFWPLIVTNKPQMYTLPVALTLLRNAYGAESWGPIMAGAVVSAIPTLMIFIVANRYIVEGVQFSGMKT